MRYTTDEGTSVEIIEHMGRSGGRGVVYDVEGQPGMVAKIFKPEFRDAERCQKVHALIPALAGVKGVVAPSSCLYGDGGSFAGFAMEKATGDTLFRLLRQQRLSLSYRVQIGYEITKIVRRLHARRIIVGDLDAHNIMVGGDGAVKLIDADSFQLPGDGYICPVHEAHCKSPEMLRYGLAGALLSEESDSFLLGYILHWLVFLADPFLDPLEATEGADRINRQTNNIASGTFAYRESPDALPATIAGAGLAQLFHDCFTGHPPAVRLWESSLRMLLEQRFELCECGWEVPMSLVACPCCGRKMMRLGDEDSRCSHAHVSRRGATRRDAARASSKKMPLRFLGTKAAATSAPLKGVAKGAAALCALFTVGVLWNATAFDMQEAPRALAALDVSGAFNQAVGSLVSADIPTTIANAFDQAVSSVATGASNAFGAAASEISGMLDAAAAGAFEGAAGAASAVGQGIENLVQDVCEGVENLW